MKSFVLILSVCFLMACNTKKVESENIISNNKFLVGTWTGEGEFLDTDIKDKAGKISFEINISNDQSITGKAGDAIINDLSISKTDYGFEIKGILDSEMNDDIPLERKHLIILLITPKNTDSTLKACDANFHVKSNFNFDVKMRVGGMTMRKTII